ncbi:MAG TPA: hypothetical protein VJI75_02015 [Candidatus Nanoarchaeia archaeon]|nr:hypothetical protein [Candidatus Nanoarchaeia archaeon]
MNGLYQSKEWKSLGSIDRAQLLLVIEGLKRGTIISGNWTSFIDILGKTGLEYTLNTPKYRLYPAMVVAKPEVLTEVARRELTVPERPRKGEYHKINGWMLGYPECCTEEYIRERTPKQKLDRKNGQHILTYKFGKEISDLLQDGGKYPEFLDYRPPSFTPCGVNCPEAAKVLTSWKEAIDALDPEAGKGLVCFNKDSINYFLKDLPKKRD